MQFLINCFVKKPDEVTPQPIAAPLSLNGAEMHQLVLALAAWNASNPGLLGARSAEFKVANMYAAGQRWIRENR